MTLCDSLLFSDSMRVNGGGGPWMVTVPITTFLAVQQVKSAVVPAGASVRIELD
jgi:hypothetical protein